MNDPFVTQCEVPVAGGVLSVARAGPSVERAEGVVLLVHGITASHLAWRAVARELVEETGVCVLAPDLRGRGRSSTLPAPYGMAAHVADLVALLDHATAAPVVLGGHSMGAYVAAELAADHAERVSNVVLVDGGLPIPVPADKDPEELLEATLGAALQRLGKTFPTREDYISMWRAHPAFVASWNSDVDAYVEYDLESTPSAELPDAVGSVVSQDAVRTDGRDLMLDEETRTALARVRAPVWLLRSPRGLLDEADHPLIPREMLDEYAAAHPDARVENVEETNHYTLLLGQGPGPSRVAAAFRAALEHSP
ncbi:MAG: lipase [Thermoleophilaceae bacterium]|nr:lipase [Thermoleophilaceae bacterium]